MGVSAFLDWVGQLPLGTLYLLLAVTAAAENVIPPLPADSVVAVGSLLAARGHGSPWVVLAVVWAGNLAGAMGVYFLGRRYGAHRLERRLFGDRAEQVEQKLAGYYGRFGLAAIFLGRFIPGVRALVPPFAGAMRVPPLVAAGLMGSASGIWYGAVSYVGFTVGADWPTVMRVLTRDARVVSVAAAIVALVLGGLWFARRKRP